MSNLPTRLSEEIKNKTAFYIHAIVFLSMKIYAMHIMLSMLKMAISIYIWVFFQNIKFIFDFDHDLPRLLLFGSASSIITTQSSLANSSHSTDSPELLLNKCFRLSTPQKTAISAIPGCSSPGPCVTEKSKNRLQPKPNTTIIIVLLDST